MSNPVSGTREATRRYPQGDTLEGAPSRPEHQTMQPGLAIVIVNYRTAQLVVECLHSLAPQAEELPGVRVVVVDNHSDDGSAGVLDLAIGRNQWSRWVSLLALEVNGGFSAGNNAGIRLLLRESVVPDFFLLLNPDTIVCPGAVRSLLDFAVENPGAGIVGSQMEGADGGVQASAFRFHSIFTEFDGAFRLGILSRSLAGWALILPPSTAPRRADWVSGASMLVRREVLESVGMLDEKYFLYFEEVDLCRRASREGWECWTDPGSRVIHLEGKATGVDFAARRLPGYVFDSRRRYFTKNHGLAYAAMADLAWILGHLAWRLRMRVQGRREQIPPLLLRDFLRHSVLLHRNDGSMPRGP